MSSIVHPTAIISPQAQLADDVFVGPGVIVEAGAIIGSGCRLLAHSIITGNVRMGADNEIGYGAIIGAPPQDFSFQQGTKSDVVIGNGNTFREYVTLHRGSKEASSTTIGNDNFLMVGVHIGHNSSVGNNVVIANNCLIAGHVEIHDRANLGGGSVFHQFIRIGKLAMVRGGSRISKNIPPYLVAYESDLVSGLNAVGLRRAGMSAEVRMELKKAFQLLYRSGLNVSQALEAAAEKIWSPEAQHFFDFVRASSKRGVCNVHISSRGQTLRQDELES